MNKNQKRITLIVIVLIILVGIGGTGYYFWNRMNQQEDSNQMNIITNERGEIVVSKINYPAEFKGLLTELHIENDQMSVLSNPEFTASGYPSYLPGSYKFMARVISFDDNILGEYGFDDPRIILGEQGYQGPTWLHSTDFTLIIPYFENAQKINIYSSTELLLSISISDLILNKEVDKNETSISAMYFIRDSFNLGDKTFKVKTIEEETFEIKTNDKTKIYNISYNLSGNEEINNRTFSEFANSMINEKNEAFIVENPNEIYIYGGYTIKGILLNDNTIEASEIFAVIQ